MAERGKTRHHTERRSSRRINVSLPLLVRGGDVHGNSFEDTTSSYNLSRNSASFTTTRELAVGQRLELIIPRRARPGQSPSQADFETTAEVRRIAPRGEARWEVGVQFIGPRLRTWVPESA